MQAQESSIENPLLSLTVSEQLVFLVESTPVNNLDNYSRERYLFAVITGCIADLFILNKIHFENSLICLNNNPQQVSPYLTDIMKEILSNREEKSILNILLSMNSHQMSHIESMIVQNLIDKKLLVRDHDGSFIFGKRFLHTNNNDFRFNLFDVLKDRLNATKKPPKELTLLLTLLNEIDFLPALFNSPHDLDYSHKHLQTFIKHDNIAKLLARAIQNEMKLKNLDKMPHHQGGGLSIGRIF